MNQKFLSVVLFIAGGLFIGSFFFEDSPSKNKAEAKKEKKTIQDTLYGYDIVRFNKKLNFYEGSAMTCDGLGGCDSVLFTSSIKPKIGKARFVPSYGSIGDVNGWILAKQ